MTHRSWQARAASERPSFLTIDCLTPQGMADSVSDSNAQTDERQMVHGIYQPPMANPSNNAPADSFQSVLCFLEVDEGWGTRQTSKTWWRATRSQSTVWCREFRSRISSQLGEHLAVLVDPQATVASQRASLQSVKFLACKGRAARDAHEDLENPEDPEGHAMHRIACGCLCKTHELITHLLQRSVQLDWTADALWALDGLICVDTQSVMTASRDCQALIASGFPPILAQLIRVPVSPQGRLAAIQVCTNFVLDSVECRDIVLALEIDRTLATLFETVDTDSHYGHRLVAASIDALRSIACEHDHSKAPSLSPERVQSYFPAFHYGLSREDTCQDALAAFQLLTKDDTPGPVRNLQLMLSMGVVQRVFGWIHSGVDHDTVHDALLLLNNVAKRYPDLMYDMMRTTLVQSAWSKVHYALCYARPPSVQSVAAGLLCTLCRHAPSIVCALEHGLFQVCIKRFSSPRCSKKRRQVCKWLFLAIRHAMENTDVRNRQTILGMGLLPSLRTLHRRLLHASQHLRCQVHDLIRVLDPEAEGPDVDLQQPGLDLPMAESASPSGSVLGHDSYVGSDRMGPMRHIRRTQAIKSLLASHPYSHPSKTSHGSQRPEGPEGSSGPSNVDASLPCLWEP
jgi:hypothetical protein